MPDLFLSYKVERRAAARHLAKILQLHGYDVWFEHGQVAGPSFTKDIEAARSGAKLLLALWCRMSIHSAHVAEEARNAHRAGKLLSCIIEPTTVPSDLSAAPTAALSDWDGGPRAPSLAALFSEITRLTGLPPRPDDAGLLEFEADWAERGSPSIAEFSVQPVFATRSQIAALLTPPQPMRAAPTQRTESPSPPPALAAPPQADAELRSLLQRANAGDAAAQYEVGRLHQNGEGGMAKDEAAALKLYQAAANQGEASAQFALGEFFKLGRAGLQRDETRAAQLYKSAAAKGYAPAQTAFGTMLQEGLGGLGKDETEAVRFFSAAAEQNYAPAQTHLGWMHQNGLGGLEPDEDEAVRLYRLAARQGSALAQHYLGRIYAKRGG